MKWTTGKQSILLRAGGNAGNEMGIFFLGGIKVFSRGGSSSYDQNYRLLVA
jgi:hypothetical protein